MTGNGTKAPNEHGGFSWSMSGGEMYVFVVSMLDQQVFKS